MKMTMRARSRFTGYVHKIIDEKIDTKRVSLNEDGSVSVKVNINNIDTSGNFTGDIALSLSELHYLIGILEEKKLQLLLKEVK
jgi:hypothetical protein